jgi:HEAT repeat protein
MLNPEIAQARLKEYQVTDWQPVRLAKLAKLPAKLRSIGYGILAHDDKGNPVKIDYYNQSSIIEDNIKHLNGLKPADRLKIFEILFPQFAAVVEAAWQSFETSWTYQDGYNRKSFRVPGATSSKQRSWLQTLINLVRNYEPDLPWLASWCAYLGYYTDSLGYLFAAAINIDDAVGKEIYEILIASAKGEHEIGAMGRHVVRSLLLANRPEGWEFVEKLLIAAQRQEGLRQSILESIDEAHPIAFQRMLRLILDENLIRFAATLRAVDVWFGFDLDVLQEKQARAIVAQVLEFLTDPHQQQSGLASDDAQTVYLALWSIGFTNAMTAIESAKVLLQHPEASHRFVAVHFLRQLKLTPALLVIITAIEDPDDRVAWLALRSISAPGELVAAVPDTFDRIVALLPRWTPKQKELPKLVWDWIVLTASQEQLVGIFLYWLGKRSPKLMIPYLGICGADNRGSIVVLLAKVKPIDAEIRKALLNLTGDASSFIRQQVMFALEKCEIEPDEATHLIGLLTRKSSDLRQGILGLLIKQPDLNAIDSAQKLLAAKDILQRQAGLELLAELVKVDRSVDECQSIAQSYQAKKGDKLTSPETQLLDRISVRVEQPVTLRDALGLVNLADLYTPKPVTCKNPVEINTAAAKSTLLAIDELIHKHSQTPVQIKDYSGEDVEYLFGSLTWQFPSIDPNLSRDENLARFPLADVWKNWYVGKRVKDQDSLELIRAAAPRYQTTNEYNNSPEPELELHDTASAYFQIRNIFHASFGEPKLDLRYPDLVAGIINWLIYRYEQPQKTDFSLNLLATVLSCLDPIELEHKIATAPPRNEYSFYDLEFFVRDLKEFSELPTEHAAADFQRRWKMTTWMDLSVWRRFIQWGLATSFEDVSIAHSHKLVSLADIIYYLIGDRFGQDIPDSPILLEPIRTNFFDLHNLTQFKLYGETYPPAIEAAKLCRDRILEIECQRGDLPTAATSAAFSLGAVEGISTVVKLLQALETTGLKRNSGWSDEGKGAVISQLMRNSFPLLGETPVEFARQVRAAKISDEKLIQFAFFAPQWVNYIQHSIDIPGFADGVWWIHAHTKDSSVPADARDVYIAQIGERTPLSEESLRDGAVDVEWFQRAHTALGAANWKRFDGAAQYACSGAGHQRAKQFASAMLGELDRKELIDRVVKKRHQDSVRALGLCPLDSGKQRETDILARYKTYQEFSRTSKQFGTQRRASEKLCVEIGMENLARTAGFADPQRLQWAMEAVEIADLVIEPQVVLIDDTTVKLRISVAGKPEISIEKAGKTLKAVPAKLKKNPDIEALLDRKQDIVKQASRMRISLEQAMDRGDAFTSAELHQLAQHPVLAPMLRQLVLIADTPNPDIGYLQANGTELVNPHGTVQITTAKLRIAHPHDLLITKEWHLWQAECFASERQQPFKQVFRELYVVTTGEQTKTGSKRYEGHQVNPCQAIALFGQRGWLSSLGEGVRRTFHQAGIIATVSFANGYYTPMDVEGLTIDRLNFYKRDDSKSIPLADIPPRIFSEVMRDLDLVVSVAHIGGVDPEASASTVEMRSSILRETCRLMKLNNVQIQGSHALIKGEIGTYSVHLGSAIVHRQPGGSICILPVSSQHRGRLFLPFVDDDPKTAEIMSKVLLLAKDKEIQDPTILEQILS